MREIAAIIQTLKESWAVPKAAIHAGEKCPFELTCKFEKGICWSEERHRLKVPNIPTHLIEFWEICGGAELFVDLVYGQWGLKVLSPIEAAAETARIVELRPGDFVGSDLVVGKFYGDSDLLLLRCDSSVGDYGEVLVALPLYGRSEWYRASPSLRDFLDTYLASSGEKFWERSSRFAH